MSIVVISREESLSNEVDISLSLFTSEWSGNAMLCSGLE